MCKASDVANFFIRLSLSDSEDYITNLKLNKLMYYAQGWSLARLGKPLFQNDIQAWKYGPVIPSVYHSFKHNGNNPITRKSEIAVSESADGTLDFSTPEVKDKDIMMVLDFVWDRYRNMSTSELIALLHREDTPWAYCYRVGRNVEIPDLITKAYYDSIVNNNNA